MAETDDCMGCATARGDAAADEVYRDERVVAVVARHAINPGHLVVVTREHVRNALVMDEALLFHMMRVARLLALALRNAFGDVGVMLVFNNEAPCQTLFHAHLHVVPRLSGDSMDIRYGEAVPEAERAEMARRLRPHTAAPLTLSEPGGL